MRGVLIQSILVVLTAGVMPAAAVAQRPAVPPADVPTLAEGNQGVPLPPGYLVGPEDTLSIVFWREPELSAEVVVRPDGKISLPLLNDVEAAGLTPDQLRERITTEATKFVENPNPTVVVRQINSRRVFITGTVRNPGAFPLATGMDVLQLIALAGGLAEYADSKNVVIIRKAGEQVRYHRFNYDDVVRQRNVQQNIELQPGDTVVVP